MPPGPVSRLRDRRALGQLPRDVRRRQLHRLAVGEIPPPANEHLGADRELQPDRDLVRRLDALDPEHLDPRHATLGLELGQVRRPPSLAMPPREAVMREPAHRRSIANEACRGRARSAPGPRCEAGSTACRIVPRATPCASISACSLGSCCAGRELAPLDRRPQLICDLLEDRTVAGRIDGHGHVQDLHSYGRLAKPIRARRRFRATPKHSVSVAAAIIDDDGRFLVIRRADNGRWEPPGGVLELDESIEAGLVREVEEETGLRVEPRRADRRLQEHAPRDRRARVPLPVLSDTLHPTAEAVEVAWMSEAQLPSAHVRGLPCPLDGRCGARSSSRPNSRRQALVR